MIAEKGETLKHGNFRLDPRVVHYGKVSIKTKGPIGSITPCFTTRLVRRSHTWHAGRQTHTGIFRQSTPSCVLREDRPTGSYNAATCVTEPIGHESFRCGCDVSPQCLPLRVEHCLFRGLSISSTRKKLWIFEGLQSQKKINISDVPFVPFLITHLARCGDLFGTYTVDDAINELGFGRVQLKSLLFTLLLFVSHPVQAFKKTSGLCCSNQRSGLKTPLINLLLGWDQSFT